MRILQKTLTFALWSLVAALGQYELAAKSEPWLATSLPGSLEARLADRGTPYRRWTRLPLVDRVIHEGREAVGYYERLLR